MGGPLGELHCHILLFVMVRALPLADTHAEQIHNGHAVLVRLASSKTNSNTASRCRREREREREREKSSGEGLLEGTHLTISTGTKKASLWEVES